MDECDKVKRIGDGFLIYPNLDSGKSLEQLFDEGYITNDAYFAAIKERENPPIIHNISVEVFKEDLDYKAVPYPKYEKLEEQKEQIQKELNYVKQEYFEMKKFFSYSL